MQLSIYEMLYDKVQIDKPIRLIELFAGYGSQALALSYLGVNYERWKIVEWNYKSTHAYRLLHCNDVEDYASDKDAEEITQYLCSKGLSRNWNEPMTIKQITKMSKSQQKQIYNDMIATHNLGNITGVTSQQLEIDNDHAYILTYSFPCQSISLAGKGEGMEEEKQTRSSMLWQVGRLLKECYADNKLPDVLLMENVPMIHSIENVGQFNKWMLDLEKLGYQNYWKDLIATDYGVPQIRNRTFMVSVKNRYYEFPKPMPLQSRLVDLLEDNVDESFYINEEDMKKLIYDNSPKNLHIKCATKQGYLEATLGDGVDISKRMRTHRGTVQKGKSQTLSTMGGSTQGVVAKITPKVIAGYGKVGSTNQYHQQNRVYEGNTAISVTTAFNPYYKTDLCIRKITPRECFRLMGVKDEDINKLAELPNNVQYHLAGDSIVTTVLMAIFGEMLNIDWQNKVKDIMERMCK